MGDIEIHIKAGDITYDKTFDAGDREVAREAQEIVSFILGHAAGATTPSRPPRAPKKPGPTSSGPIATAD